MDVVTRFLSRKSFQRALCNASPLIISIALCVATPTFAQKRPPLELVQTITLPGVRGRDDTTVELLGRPVLLEHCTADSGLDVELTSRPPEGPAIALRICPI